ncbi:fibroblast growth factor receptor-like 1 [Ptychodera flava]|uniref:fibroblast growth factor receptor-like 1 n=1 Tax=Ptychodera flava TaxID=63121 RepID=UPI003969F48F
MKTKMGRSLVVLMLVVEVLSDTKERARLTFDNKKWMKANQIKTRPEGSSFTMKCRASGLPKPRINWTKDGQEVIRQQRRTGRWTLKLSNLKANDSGSYTCRVSNKLDTITFAYHLQVIESVSPLSKPTIIDEYPKNVTCNIGDTVVFWCVVYSELRSVSIHWARRVEPHMNVTNYEDYTKNKIDHESGETYLYLNKSEVWERDNNTYHGKLMLERVEADDAGVYACICLSTFGFDYKLAILNIVSPGYGMDMDFKSYTKEKLHLYMKLFAPSVAYTIIAVTFLVITHRCVFRKQFADDSGLNTRYEHSNSNDNGSDNNSDGLDEDNAVRHELFILGESHASHSTDIGESCTSPGSDLEIESTV